MSDYDTPSANITISGDPTGSPGEHVYYHLDELDEYEDHPELSLRVYTYDDEDREGEHIATLERLKKDFIFAHGTVFPAWVRDEMPLETDVLNALEWCIALYGTVEPDDLEVIKEEIKKYE